MKSVAFFGDSITTFKDWIPPENESYYPRGDVDSAEKTWWHQVMMKKGYELAINQSYSGSRVTPTGPRPCYSVFTSNHRLPSVKADVIIVFAGINDACQMTEPASAEVFRSYFEYMLDTLRKNNPVSEIYVMSHFLFPGWKADVLNPEGWGQHDLYSIISECVSSRDMTLIDLHKKMDTADKEEFFLEGTVHPSAKGMSLISDIVVSYLR